MGAVGDEVYSGERCAVCEERFAAGDDVRYLPASGERVHAGCWS